MKQERRKGLLHAPPAEEDAFFNGEAKATMEDVFLLNELHTDTVEDRVAKLNADQLRIFNNINDHLCHQKLHENSKCSCTTHKPLSMFISGVGGTGKSFLIHMIRGKVNELWKDNKIPSGVHSQLLRDWLHLT